jgi:hypothetical protein
MAEALRAELGDIVYLSDARWWLGGLRSIHAKISEIRTAEDSTVLVARSLMRSGSLQPDRPHNIERIL